MRKIWLATPICAAGHRRSVFTCKRGRGLRHSAQMTMPNMTRKIRVFFFTGLDRSRLTNLDQSRFVRFWKKNTTLNCSFSYQSIVCHTVHMWSTVMTMTLCTVVFCVFCLQII